MPALIRPTIDLHQSWLASRDEWGVGYLQPGAGTHDQDAFDTPEQFQDWIDRLAREADVTVELPADRVHCDYFWIVEDGEYLGAIALRHELNDFLLAAGGHIGYGVRPSARGRGLALWALRQVLAVARDRGMDRVLLTCEDANVASYRTIEAAGGVLEDIRETELGATRRYWIDLDCQAGIISLA